MQLFVVKKDNKTPPGKKDQWFRQCFSQSWFLVMMISLPCASVWGSFNACSNGSLRANCMLVGFVLIIYWIVRVTLNAFRWRLHILLGKRRTKHPQEKRSAIQTMLQSMLFSCRAIAVCLVRQSRLRQFPSHTRKQSPTWYFHIVSNLIIPSSEGITSHQECASHI